MIIDKKEYQFLSNMYILCMKNVRRNEYFMYTYSINQRTILHWVPCYFKSYRETLQAQLIDEGTFIIHKHPRDITEHGSRVLRF